MRLREGIVTIACWLVSSLAPAASLAAGTPITVDERAVRVRLFDDRSVVTLPAAYAGESPLPVRVHVAILDPGEVAFASVAADRELQAGRNTLRLTLRPALGDVPEVERD